MVLSVVMLKNCALFAASQNDIVVAVCGTKVTNTKQAAKLIKQAGER